jgi:hypothetical protein
MVVNLSLKARPFLKWWEKPTTIIKVDKFFHFANGDSD